MWRDDKKGDVSCKYSYSVRKIQKLGFQEPLTQPYCCKSQYFD